jgi:hypothetical protein
MGDRTHLSLLTDAVAEALSGHRCVSAWLGYGNALFLGFGPERLAPLTPDGQRSLPPFELQTSMADWRVGSVSCEDERESAERAIAELVDRPVTGWRLSNGRSLTIEFSGGRALQVGPPDEAVPDLDEWWFCLPGSRFVGVDGEGQIISGDSGYQ